MTRRMILGTALATAVAAGVAFAPAASARTAWNVTIGGPGFAVSAGEPYVGAPYRPYWRHHRHYYRHYAPPVVYRPYPAPYYYAPPRVIYRPPVVYRPSYPY